MFSNETELAAYLDERDRRLYSRLLLNRYFQGKITAVSGTAPPFQVQVTRTGETNPANNWYACNVPGYLPRVGDLVELVWRDDAVGYVFQPLASTAALANRFLLSSAKITQPTASVSLDSIPGGVRNLVLSGRVFGTDAAGAFINWQANGDGGSNYSSQRVYGNGGTPSAQLARSAASSCYIGSASASGYATGATFTCMIPGANLAGNHVFHSIVSRFEVGVTVAELWANWWTAAGFAGPITTMTMWPTAGNFDTGTLFELYGDF